MSKKVRQIEVGVKGPYYMHKIVERARGVDVIFDTKEKWEVGLMFRLKGYHRYFRVMEVQASVDWNLEAPAITYRVVAITAPEPR